MNILYLAAGNYYFDNRDYFSFNAIHNSALVAAYERVEGGGALINFY